MAKRAEIEFISGPHSSQKDHTIMPGGTLIEDKRIVSSERLGLHQYLLPIKTPQTDEFHQGMHTLEHMLAYSPETGSLRTQMVKATRKARSGKAILDVSPFRIDEDHFAFRATSVLPLNPASLEKAYLHSLAIGTEYIQNGGLPPFATPGQCGQYDFHSPQAALEIIQATQNALLRGETNVEEIPPAEPTATTITVADLRLIRPKAEGAHDQRMLHPTSSHLISQVLEHFVHKGMPDGQAGQVKFGTFGCMTGDYTMVMDKPLPQIHVAIARTLSMLSEFAESDDEEMHQLGLDAQFCLDHIQATSPDIFAEAQAKGPIEIKTEEQPPLYLRRDGFRNTTL
ncbi:MAG TPA: S-ribosylhomocysteine lyase [Patescibacteria group bacterium]|nr:S-ribosylhomocysteine lyase [Patescibacteria group bacterium]